MRVAVTGATGFLGRHIVNHLLGSGYTCCCWYRPGSDRSGFLNGGDGITWLPGNLNDAAATTKLVKNVDAVVHCALERKGNWSPSDTDLIDFVQANVVGSIRLIQTARISGVTRFVFISTCAVHEVILNDRPLDESHPLWPMSHYGAHKAAIEKFVHSFGLASTGSPNGWDICALRPTGIYGLAQPIDRSKWFGLVRDVVAGKRVDNTAGGKEVHAADVARAVGILLTTPTGTIAGQSYNCYDMYVTAADVARIARHLTGSASVVAENVREPKHQIDTSRLKSIGMHFGGKKLLEQTIAQLLAGVDHTPSTNLSH